MDYYRRKNQAMNLAIQLAKTGTISIEDVAFEVLKKTCISENFTIKFLKNEVKRGNFVEDHGIIMNPEDAVTGEWQIKNYVFDPKIFIFKAVFAVFWGKIFKVFINEFRA